MASHDMVEERPDPFLQVLKHMEGTGCEYLKYCRAEKWEVYSDIEYLEKEKFSANCLFKKCSLNFHICKCPSFSY